MKKLISILLFALILINPFAAKALSISAKSAVVIDADTMRILYAKNAKEIMSMASTTKIMTGLLAAEYGNGDALVTVSQNAAYQEGSSMYLKVGEKVKMSELLYGLMLSSGNDAAVAIAEQISQSSEKFAEKMTERARAIGAYQTSFKNPNGLDEEGHYTTAYDLALIMAHAMKNEIFAKTVATRQITLERGTYTNHNKLLSSCEGVIGGKTGFTKKSGRCLVTVCEREDFRVIAVTLSAPDDWNDHRNMLDYTYENYKCVNPFSAGAVICEITAENGEKTGAVCKTDLKYYLNAEEQKRVEIINDLPPTLKLPVKSGQKLGKVTMMLDGVILCESPLLANRDILLPPEESFYDFLIKASKIFAKAFR